MSAEEPAVPVREQDNTVWNTGQSWQKLLRIRGNHGTERKCSLTEDGTVQTSVMPILPLF